MDHISMNYWVLQPTCMLNDGSKRQNNPKFIKLEPMKVPLGTSCFLHTTAHGISSSFITKVINTFSKSFYSTINKIYKKSQNMPCS